jgi:Fuc2NAc and GlcNAc transferase
MNNLLLFSFVIFTSLLFTELIRRYSLKKKLLDTPNERSSHSVAIPRGGGLSIVVCFLMAINFSDFLPSNIVYALTGSGLLIAGVGFWDDHGHISAIWRLLSHFMGAAWVLFWLGGGTDFQLFEYNVNTGWLGIVLATFVLIWLLNLFNFMDGIDGIAASETIFIACAGAIFFWMHGLDDLRYVSLLLAASSTGFLILNWAPAKIFMGDVGSGFLGLMLGALAYASILQGMSVWVWLILFAVFFVDSGITLLRRMIKGEKWYKAHCSHAYQHAARRWGHKRVTISVIIIDLFWLLPVATLAYLKPDFGFLLTLLTFAPLIVVALKFKAGITNAI